jgi:diaminohydroxyphosphoribosylaminopyrimidine deaminase/5-amino-6-(5-phosphoribosylamino)uracil reductase
LIDAGVERVVACHVDPNPQAQGGFEHLRAAGVAVECGVLGDQAARLNWQFLAAQRWKRPAVTVKWAASLDGKIATVTGDSQWISSPASRKWALDERETHDAILVGSGTVLADDPRLDRRLGRARHPNVRVVLDRRLRTPPTARMLNVPGEVPGEVLVYAAATADPRRVRALEDRGATVVLSDSVTPTFVLADLFDRGIRSLLVEGGGEVASAFVADGSFDRVAVVCAPILIGGHQATGPLGGPGVKLLADAPRLDALRVDRRGDDLLISGFRHQCLPDLFASVGV